VGHPAVELVRGRVVTLEADGIIAYADGERFGPLPLTVEAVPGAVTVLAPATP
jgi:diacylglycerol kinase (ATP)